MDQYSWRFTVLDRPWVDLLKVVRYHYYHPEFRGSYSINAVLPALVPGFGYKDLDIQGGEVASNAFLESIDQGTLPERRDKRRADLLKYSNQFAHELAITRRTRRQRNSLQRFRQIRSSLR